MRFFRLTHNFNWQYIIGEILLIFIGISLAIWFNNWNTSSKNSRAKEIAIVKIKDEITNNIEELSLMRKGNSLIVHAFSEYKQWFDGTSSQITATPEQFGVLKRKYPGFYSAVDSVALRGGRYIYKGGTYIQLELPTLTNIAWETTKSISITNEFSYECLYDMESMYNLQGRVQTEVNKASDALQNREINQLMNILEFLDQLSAQLDHQYNEMLTGIENCS